MNGQMNYHNGFRDKVEVNVSRPASYAQLVMGSEDRYRTFNDKFNNPKTANNFVIESKQPFLSGYFTRLAVPTISVKYSVPTIVEGVNDKLTINVYDLDPYGYETTETFTLPEGFYTAAEMVSVMTAKFAAIPGGNTYGLACVLGDTGLVFSAAAGYGITFSGTGDNDFTDTYSNNIRIYNVLGVNGYNIEGSSLILSVGAQNKVYCSAFQSNYTAYIDICSDTLTKYQSVKDNMTRPVNNKAGVIARIYTTPFNQKEYTNDDLESPSGVSKLGPYNIDTDYNNPKWIKWSPDEYIYSIDIQLYDQYGELLYWSPEYNTEFDMTILASES